MSKFLHTDVQDALLSYISSNATRLCVCSTQPTTYTEAITTYELGDVTLSGADFSLAAGDVSGRKVTIAQKSNLAVDNSGTAGFIALVDVSNAKLLAVTTCTSQALTSGNTVTSPAFDIEVNDPT